MAKPLKLTPSKAHTVARKKTAAPSVKEAEIQRALIDWSKWARGTYPDLEWLFAIPNGVPLHGTQKFAIVNWLKGMGMRPGIPDLCLPCPRGNYSGMFIELKTEEGVLSPEQTYWIEHLSVAYKVVVCRSLKAAINAIKTYLGDD